MCYKSLANYNGTCLNYCPAGNYIAVSTGDSNFTSICRPCNLPCLQCDGADQYKCFSCVANYYLYGVMCLTSCPVGLYPNTFQRTCNVCPFGCFECTSLWTCTACIVNYKLSSTNQCVNPNTPTCSLANCSVCNDGLKCDLCISGYVALQGACVTNCPDGTRLQDRSCLACPTNCLKCTAISCYTCATNYYLFAGNCVTACPVAMLPDNGICKTNPCVSYQNH